jgi:hypothetical protein
LVARNSIALRADHFSYDPIPKRLTYDEATMFLINAQTQDRAFTRSLASVKASNAFRSAPKENRVPEWKTGGAIFICDSGEVAA